MEQLDIDTLSDIDLAVAVAREVMRWQTCTDATGVSCRHDNAPWFDWQPWRDMRAAWEIVEKMVADGWYFSVMTPASNKGDTQWNAVFAKRIDGDLFGYERLGDNPGVAIMRAVLAAVRSAK